MIGGFLWYLLGELRSCCLRSCKEGSPAVGCPWRPALTSVQRRMSHSSSSTLLLPVPVCIPPPTPTPDVLCLFGLTLKDHLIFFSHIESGVPREREGGREEKKGGGVESERKTTTNIVKLEIQTLVKISLGCCDGVTFHMGRTTICFRSPYYKLSTACGTGSVHLCMLTKYINGQLQLTLVRPQGPSLKVIWFQDFCPLSLIDTIRFFF